MYLSHLWTFTVVAGLVFHFYYVFAFQLVVSFDDVKVVRRVGVKQRVKHAISLVKFPVLTGIISLTVVVDNCKK